MSQPLDRNRLYALIGSFEDDLRRTIRTHLLPLHDEQHVLGPSYEKAAERYLADTDGAVEQADVVDYLDLGDEIGILQRFKKDLPPDLQTALASSGPRLEQLVGIRNRVMHRRPLLPDDYDNAARWLVELDQQAGLVGSSLAATLLHLRDDPTWAPASALGASTPQRTANNLPIPDFDETGLVGRRKQVEDIKAFLLRRRFPVLTLIGPGGVGKTALALQVLHELADDSDSPFEMIAWVSLKTEILTAAGVERIEGAIRSIDRAVPHLAAPLDTEFTGSLDDLGAALDGIPAIIAIDNLETVSADEVIALIDRLPSVTWLFTSRVGLGQLERREPVAPLELGPAEDLFRRLSRARNLDHLARLPRRRVLEVLNLLGTAPLALKWFTLAVESGQAPDTILRQQTDLMRFCVQNVYRGLSETTKDVAVILAHVHRPLSVGDIKLHLLDRTPDSLRQSFQELLRRSLCSVSMLQDSLIEQFEATDPLVEYLKIAGTSRVELMHRIQETEDEYRREEERLRLEQARSPLRVNVIAGTEGHRASGLRLREALRQSAARAIDEALETIDEVEQLDPEYWELFRVRGFILSQSGRVMEATDAYERALELAPSPEERARVQFFYAGHLTRTVRDSEGALEHAAAAHQVLRLPASALELGKALTYTGDFSAAIQHLEEASEVRDARAQLIAGTQLVDTLRRRAEGEAGDLRSPEKAAGTLTEALRRGQSMLSNGVRDERLESQMYRCLSDLMNVSRGVSSRVRDSALAEALSACDTLPAPSSDKEAGYLAAHANRLKHDGLPDDISRRLDRYCSPMPGVRERAVDVGAELIGHVASLKGDRGFGFIAGVDGNDYFFHVSDLQDGLSLLDMSRGAGVRFMVSESDGKRRAAMVQLTERPDGSALRSRHGKVTRTGVTYLLLQDAESSVSVLVSKSALRRPGDWLEVATETTLEYDAEIDASGRVRAARRSVTIVTSGFGRT